MRSNRTPAGALAPARTLPAWPVIGGAPATSSGENPMSTKHVKPVGIAIGTALLGSLSLAQIANAR